MKYLPIIESVRAILDGRKTQTRRVNGLDRINKPSPDEWKSVYQDGGGNWVAWSSDSPSHAKFTKKAYPNGEGFKCPYGQVGDRLWLRETWAVSKDWGLNVPDHIRKKNPILKNYFREYDNLKPSELNKDTQIWYLADGDKPKWCGKTRSSIFMPRWASRLTLEITDIRVERLQDMSDEDMIAEGLYDRYDYSKAQRVWNKLNAKRGFDWTSNPWVWVISFKDVK